MAKPFLSKSDVELPLLKGQVAIKKVESLGGSARHGYYPKFSYEVIGIKEKDFRGLLRRNTAEALIRQTNKSRVILNTSSGTGSGWYYWVQRVNG